MTVLIVAAAVAVVVLVAALALRRRSGGEAESPAPGSGERLRPVVAEFHVTDGSAMVHFEVPLPADGADAVLSDLLGREAVEVVREKRHTLPLGDVHRVVAWGRSGSDWAQVAEIGLDTPGELPPPVVPELLPHASRGDFDPFERFDELPEHAPGLADARRGEELEKISLKLPAVATAGLRAQGVDPDAVDAAETVVRLMRTAGYSLPEGGGDTFVGSRAGETVFVRTVPHERGEHPELAEEEIRRFVVDFGASGAARGLLITEKYSPFEIYDRERRDPRMRFITRERLQGFADRLSLG